MGLRTAAPSKYRRLAMGTDELLIPISAVVYRSWLGTMTFPKTLPRMA